MYSNDRYTDAQRRAMYHQQTLQRQYLQAQHIDSDEEEEEEDDDDDEDEDDHDHRKPHDSPMMYARQRRDDYTSSNESSPRSYGSQPSYSRSPPSYRPPQRRNIPYRQTSSSQQQQDQNQPQPSSSTPQTENKTKFYCLYYICASRNVGFTRKADLERHVETTHHHHMLELVDCEVPTCHRRGSQGFARRDKMWGHLREVHGVDVAGRQQGGGRRRRG